MERLLAPDVEALRQVAMAAAILLGAVAAGLLGYRWVFWLLTRLAARTESTLDDTFLNKLKGPLRLLLPLILVQIVFPTLGLPEAARGAGRHLLSIVSIAAVAWVMVAMTLAVRDMVLSRYRIDVADNLKARAVYTQIDVLVKIAMVVILVIAAGSLLMTFEKIRQIGVSLLASAGIAGIIVGFAAQRSLGTLFAGLQIAVTQPIRIDDVVIVEGEWGRIEEITLTYVVVRIWDLRRLVVPITYFLDKPFQNWTRVSADLLATVFIYADYTVPVDAVRAELTRILENCELWDRKVAGVQVTNATERGVEMRALMSAPDASKAWDLRCLVRERLITWLQAEYPAALPRVRAELRQAASQGEGEA